MDFGVAHFAGDAPDDGLVGSLPYIAPEQIRNPGGVDARTNVYELGATVYELLTGRTPFSEPSASGQVMAHLNRPPENPRTFEPTIPEAAAAAILAALAKAPDERFASAGAFAAALADSASADEQ